MPIYVTLANLTKQGITDMKAAPQRIKETIKGAEAAGVKILGFYVTMGEYDYVWIAEAPSEAVAMSTLISVGMAGNVKTKTLRAFTAEELAGFVANLP